MDTIFEIDGIKVEKEKAMERYRLFQKIAYIVRTGEVFAAILIVFFTISWSSSYVPAVFEFLGGFLRRSSSLLFSLPVMFIIGNAIVITLFANVSPSRDVEETSSDAFGVFLPENVVPDVVVAAAASPIAEVEKEKEVVEKVYRRTQSAAIVEVVKKSAAAVAEEKKEEEVVEKRELRRSSTVPRRKSGGGSVSVKAEAAAAEARRRRLCEEDELSNEEFNRKVEEFIEKQKRFLTEEFSLESKSLVLIN